jgi:signal peptidase I
MSPTFVHNDYLLVKKFDKKFDRGDIVVLRSPADPLDIFIERIVGMPNETINIENGKVVANGTPLEESYLSQPTFGTSTPFQLKENEYFVLGDNRASSSDSRYWGPVRKENIIGKIWVKVFP